MQRDIPIPVLDLRGRDLDLGVNLEFDLYLSNISFDEAWWEDYDVACILVLQPPLAELWAKNQTRPLGHLPDLWGHRLTWGLKFGFLSLSLVTADMLAFFREALDE